MSWFKSFFGDDNKDKKDIKPKSPPQNAPRSDVSAGQIREEEMEAFYDGMMSAEDIAYSLQEMDQLQGVVQPNEPIQPKGAVHPNEPTQPKGTVQPNGAKTPKNYKVYTPRILEVNTKLTVILVENTEEVAKQKDKLQKIVKGLVTTGKVCVINYGKLVTEGKIVDAKDFDCSELLYEEFMGDNACLFDALIALEGVVNENYQKTAEEFKYKKIRINEIDIIGIGRCVDNCSITSSQNAIESFCKVAKHHGVTTKYFCLTEQSFVQAATIGFHSIGAIANNYI